MDDKMITWVRYFETGVQNKICIACRLNCGPYNSDTPLFKKRFRNFKRFTCVIIFIFIFFKAYTERKTTEITIQRNKSKEKV